MSPAHPQRCQTSILSAFKSLPARNAWALAASVWNKNIGGFAPNVAAATGANGLDFHEDTCMSTSQREHNVHVHSTGTVVFYGLINNALMNI